MKKPIIAYHRSGNLSGRTTTLLQQHGIQEVYNGSRLDDLLKQSN